MLIDKISLICSHTEMKTAFIKWDLMGAKSLVAIRDGIRFLELEVQD